LPKPKKALPGDNHGPRLMAYTEITRAVDQIRKHHLTGVIQFVKMVPGVDNTSQVCVIGLEPENEIFVRYIRYRSGEHYQLDCTEHQMATITVQDLIDFIRAKSGRPHQ
jgi:hypothetical protein